MAEKFESPNKAITKGLIETQQRKDPKLYDALRKLAEDLNKVYETVFGGPLPEVDGFSLTRLDPESLEGIIPLDKLPEGIAFLDDENIFTDFQTIASDNPYLAVGFQEDSLTPPTSYIRIGSIHDGEHFLSQNLHMNGSDYERDRTDTFGSVFQFLNGAITIGVFSETHDPVPAVDFFETFKIESKTLSVANYQQNDFFEIITLGRANLIYLGESANINGEGHIAIPNKTSANLPAANFNTGAEIFSRDGLIVIDKTNHRLCFYTDGARYYVAGVAF